MVMEAIAIASLIGAGTGVYQATQNKPPKAKPVTPPAIAATGGEPVAGKKGRQYKPVAQLFKDEDLRLGMGGKLGL